MYVVANIFNQSLGTVAICPTREKAIETGVMFAVNFLDGIQEFEQDAIANALEDDLKYHTQLSDGTLYSVGIRKVQ